ncbi:MAG: glycosyltransferase family 25 protein [Syntrophales bacterium]|jgi:glycosyl transferase family 25|nr:glycosyltransferase family 25 protein [Syntrophales bacterium]MCK9527543.1 glycosyltransferase family 25 protein [Syntrophales bacterium]MDX9922600.1 glycosyltransferase family 25 protein [Syntrophales bacterium]
MIEAETGNGIYVLHVKKGYEDREKSIIRQFSALKLPFEWILDHDRDELTPEIIERFKCHSLLSGAEISCALKHIVAWNRIADGTGRGAFIFEDDVLLDIKNFKIRAEEALAEFYERWGECGYISLGNGCALYVPWTKLEKKTRLYRADYVRAADSYWITRETARKKLEWVLKHGIPLPADHLIDRIATELDIPILWLEPTIANQGSHTGLFPSSIQNLERGRLLDAIGWKVKIIRRKYLYPLLGIDMRKAD